MGILLSFLMILNPLFVFNTDLSGSLSDLTSYRTQRGMPENVLGVNFANANTETSETTIYNGTFSVQSLKWNGVVDHFQDGVTLGTGLAAIAAKYPFDAIILSTFTPLVHNGMPIGPATRPLPAILASISYIIQTGHGGSVLPNGRLGCPAVAFDQRVEMTTHSGATISGQAVTNALASEARYNKGEPHLLSTAAAYGSTNVDVSLVSDGFGFSVAYYQALMAAARASGCSFTIDLGTDYLFNGNTARDFALGQVASAIDLFGVCLPMGLNVIGSPGGQAYSNNYRVRPGGWSAHWYSFQWYWAMDFLYNGGSSVLMTVSEPLSNGIRDPALILPQMLGGACLAETLPTSATAFSCPAQAVSASYPDCITVVGDPLHRPYSRQTLTPVAAPSYF